MEVRCSVPKRTVLIVTVLIVESADPTVIPISVAIRVGIWL